MMGTLGGPGYGEFPLGSAGPRVDPRDPSYRPPPRPGGGNVNTFNPFNNPLFSDPGLGGEGGRGGDNLPISPGGSRKFAEENYGRIKNPFSQFVDGLERRGPQLPPTIPIFQPPTGGGMERGPVNGGINPVVGQRPDGSDIRLFDKDSPTRGGPGQIPPMSGSSRSR